MDAYTSFAQVYDLFMDNVPYDEWCAYICETLKKHGIADGPVLDLGCGTGELTRRLAACGYDMTGVDVSVDMLQKAMEKQTDPPILYLLQEMQKSFYNQKIFRDESLPVLSPEFQVFF